MTPDAMTPERWRAVEAILQAALDRVPSERPAFLADACGGDVALRREVESLLAGDTGVRLAAAIEGHYTMERELGRGGMATVYLARDLRQRRYVAIKVLHPELSAVLGAERFLREIELTANLQHPHILPLFDSGSADGQLYYVMPYVEGESLRARLTRERQLPVGDAVRIATEVAGALEYAHRHGVVHRDVKPENILLAEDGSALVADFGIALAVEQAGGGRLTRTGLSLGTPQYMAPEQAMGERDVDARADVYALGAVTYEMLAGEPPFTGPTAQTIVARVMTEAPRSLRALRPTVPEHVNTAVLTALEKLPADRFASGAAFASALGAPALTEPAFVRGDTPETAMRALGRRLASPRWAVTLAVGTLAALALAWALGRATGRATERASAGAAGAASERGPVRFTIELDSASLRFGAPAISPDGRTVVYWAEGPGGGRLYARRVDDVVARPLPGTENGDLPFFSPDGVWVGFSSAHGVLRKVRLDGGTSVVVTRLPPSGWFVGGSWGADDTILFATWPRGVLYRVPAGGGVPSPVAVADTTLRLLRPHLLPGGRAALVTATRDYVAWRVAVLDFATGRVRQFGPGVGARQVARSVLFVGAGGELYRQPFDLDRLEPTGTAEQIASGLDASSAMGSASASSFDVSPAGALVYRVGASRLNEGDLRLILTDRAGRELQAIAARTPWRPRFSPDGRRVAYGAFAPGRDSSDVWITDLATGATQRLTTDGNDDNDPVWSPDGKAIAYSALAVGGKDLFVQPLDGGRARVLTRRPGTQWPTDWTRDGSALLFTDGGIWVQPLDGGAARPYVVTPAHEGAARVSPDGRWVAYQSDETGRGEVYVQSYPTPGRKTLVSAGGGSNAVWAGDGRELYYWQGDQLIAARVDAGGAGTPLAVRGRTPLFRAPYFLRDETMYDVSPDGTRFILITGGPREGRLVVALDVLGSAPAAGRR